MDYKKVEFKSGLEIHAHINTHKLFCGCPSELRQDKPHFKIMRKLRPSAGETGRVDIAALYEKTKGLFYIYEGYDDTTCLVELDEEPVHEINKEALNVALMVAKMFHCTVPDTLQVMRKTVVNGSNTSGFQRTMLVGLNGYLIIGKKKIVINYVILEEEAARRIAENNESVTFRLDRLGIPELEIVTAPDMYTPEEVMKVAEAIGSVLRSTGRMRRGIGTIRQDVNISIEAHARVELKLIQDLKLIPKYVDAEIERQLKTKGEEQNVRNVKPDFSSKYLRPLPTAARMYVETDHPLIKIDKKYLDSIKLPESFEEKEKRYASLGLGKELINQILASSQIDLVDKFLKSYSKSLTPNVIVTTIISAPKEVKRKLGLDTFDLDEPTLDRIFSALSSGNIAKESITNIIEDLAKGENLYKLFDKYKILSDSEIKKIISKIKESNKGAPEGKLIGLAMSQLRGKADSKKIIELIKND